MILVTGHLGFIGSHLMKRLGDDVFGIDLKEGKNVLSCLPNPRSNEVDLIYHLAAQSSVESSWHDPVHDMDNIRITARLVHVYPQARIIYANSCASINVSSPYGFSKKGSGEYLKHFHKNYVSLVFPNIYGPRSKSVVDIFKNSEELTIYGDGTHIRDYVHVEDLVEGLLLAQNWPVGEYFMGSGISTSVLDLALQTGKPFTHEDERKEDIEVVVPNTTPNWAPQIDVMKYLND